MTRTTRVLAGTFGLLLLFGPVAAGGDDAGEDEIGDEEIIDEGD